MSNVPAGTYYVRVYGFLSVENTFVLNLNVQPLAIKLVSIDATNIEHRNHIVWTTGNEDKGDYFILEHSVDGRNFNSLATIPAKGEASVYSYWDNTPANGINYYRLKMVDAAGASNYSKVVAVTVKTDNRINISLYPNPVSDKLHIQFNDGLTHDGKIEITDVVGKVLKQVAISGNAVIGMSDLATGHYLVKYTEKEFKKTIKIMKQ